MCVRDVAETSMVHKPIRTIDCNNFAINQVIFSPNGDKIISGSYDGTIRVWDTETVKLDNTLIQNSSKIMNLAFIQNY